MKRFLILVLAVGAALQAAPAMAQSYYMRENLTKSAPVSAPADQYAEPDYGDMGEYLTPINNAALGYVAFVSRFGDVPLGLNQVSNAGLLPGPTWSSKIQVYPHFFDWSGARVFTSQDGIPLEACQKINAIYGAQPIQLVTGTPRGCFFDGGRYLVYAKVDTLNTRTSATLSASAHAMLTYVSAVGAQARTLCGSDNGACVNNPSSVGYAGSPPGNVPDGAYFNSGFIRIGSSDGRYNGPAVAFSGVSKALCATLNSGAIPDWPDAQSGCFHWYDSYQIYSYAHNPRF